MNEADILKPVQPKLSSYPTTLGLRKDWVGLGHNNLLID